MPPSDARLAPYLELHAEVADALAAGRPVVALESTAIAHGLPRPRNLVTARHLEAIVRDVGAVPATVAVLDRRIRVGLSAEALGQFAAREDVVKASRRDLAFLLASGHPGATTVAATLAVAALAGIRVFATGGIGGVHRGGAASLDVSADLAALADCPVALVSAGAKLILDLEKTLEVLETYSVPVIGYGCTSFPGFYCADAGLPLDLGVETPREAADIMRAHWTLGQGGLLFAKPIPEAAGLRRGEVEGWIAEALGEAGDAGIGGKAVTPFVLARLHELSGGRTLDANVALLEANARVAAEIACAYAASGAGADADADADADGS
jgi:pseudouridine-5'-phosphate glycosidase